MERSSCGKLARLRTAQPISDVVCRIKKLSPRFQLFYGCGISLLALLTSLAGTETAINDSEKFKERIFRESIFVSAVDVKLLLSVCGTYISQVHKIADYADQTSRNYFLRLTVDYLSLR